MANMSLKKNPMPSQDPNVRNKNFLEVALGYTEEQALDEAARCLHCKNHPCVDGCPVNVRIPEFIAKIVERDYEGAYQVIHQTSSLPAVCGRVCPQEKQCEGKCILGKKGQPVAIGRLERFVADHASAEKAPEIKKVGRRVACIGSGPSSVTCAGYLARLGVDVTMFEGLHEAGGVLIYGIPAFRLPKDVVAHELDALRAMNVDIRLNYVGGRTVTVDGLLKQGYDAVFIGVGAGLPHFLGVPGENCIGVFSANEYLTRVNLGRAHSFPAYDTPVAPGKHVTVFGAGNVAMDAARTALRLGAESVHIVYRRTRAEMPARGEEIEHALEEGVKLLELAAPVRFITDEENHLTGVELQRMELGEPDASGRRRPRPVEGQNFIQETDLAIVALGTRSNPLMLDCTPGLKLTDRGYIAVDENGETSIPNVYAGGDIVTGAATVILAMGAGRRAAQSIARKMGLE